MKILFMAADNRKSFRKLYPVISFDLCLLCGKFPENSSIWMLNKSGSDEYRNHELFTELDYIFHLEEKGITAKEKPSIPIELFIDVTKEVVLVVGKPYELIGIINTIHRYFACDENKSMEKLAIPDSYVYKIEIFSNSNGRMLLSGSGYLYRYEENREEV